MPYSYDRRRADLSPPLGYPGGPCHVVDRIEETVNNPRRRDLLEEEVQRGGKLTNPEAAAIYRLQEERGAGLWKTLQLTPHAQYRMDLRSITVPQVRASLVTLSKRILQLKSMGHPQYKAMAEDLARDRLRWIDPRLDLMLVLEGIPNGVRLVTVYWKGEEDPPPPKPGECGTEPASSYRGTR
jgi:hypothetical protein